MDNSVVIEAVTNGLWTSILVAAPVVLAASAAGIATSLLQVLTQMQDQTMQFLLKLVVVAVTLALLSGWMSGLLINYTNLIFSQIGTLR